MMALWDDPIVFLGVFVLLILLGLGVLQIGVMIVEWWRKLHPVETRNINHEEDGRWA